MGHDVRRAALAGRLAELGIDALLSTHLPNVRYLTGYSGSNGQVLVGKDDAVFFTDGRYREQARHEVPDIETVIYGGSVGFAPSLADAVKSRGLDRVGFESAYLTYESFERLGSHVPTFVSCPDPVGRLRWVKEPEEITAIERAQELSDLGFAQLLPTLAVGQTEREVARRLEWAMLEAGADGLAFETIVAFGEQAAEPHHQPTDRGLQRGDIVKIDFGALAGGYHADMTRTVAFGDPGQQMREVYAVVRASQQAGVDAVHAGVIGKDVDAVARKVIEDAGYGEAFGHGLGHGVGLEIHEGPNLAATFDEAVPAGSVVTVEPGIYLPGVGGVRIEDMVEVTVEGCRVLPATGKELVIL